MNSRRVSSIVVILPMFASLSAFAQNSNNAIESDRDYRFSLFGGGEHQFQTDIDSGGDFDLTRLGAGAALHHDFNADLSAVFQITYGVDLYDFTGTALTIVPPLSPWDDIHTVTAAAIFSYKLNQDWSVFGGPLFQSSRESGADFGDSIAAGGAIGLTYRASNDLTIGGGVAVISQIEDSVRFVPIVIVDWEFANSFHLRNTAPSNAINRTGLELVFDAGHNWEVAAGIASESSRFRLDGDASAPNGVGEHSSLPIWFRATLNPSDQVSITGIVGINTSGELRLENSVGGLIASSDYDPAFFAGVFGSLRF